MKNHIHNLFYVTPRKIHADEVIIDGATLHHVQHVLRKKADDIIFITDGKGYRYTVKITQATRTRAQAQIVERNYIQRETTLNTALAFVPLKGLRNDFIIEKATELGVQHFLPFISQNSVVRTLTQSKLNRFRKICRSAMLQSQQYYTPEINFQRDVATLVSIFRHFDLILLADKKGEYDIPQGAHSILYIVGPEGGFDKTEIELLTHHGARLLSLGIHRLRSETAAVCGITKILIAYKNM